MGWVGGEGGDGGREQVWDAEIEKDWEMCAGRKADARRERQLPRLSAPAGERERERDRGLHRSGRGTQRLLVLCGRRWTSLSESAAIAACAQRAEGEKEEERGRF